jgi:hypothetical protein
VPRWASFACRSPLGERTDFSIKGIGLVSRHSFQPKAVPFAGMYMTLYLSRYKTSFGFSSVSELLMLQQLAHRQARLLYKNANAGAALNGSGVGGYAPKLLHQATSA